MEEAQIIKRVLLIDDDPVVLQAYRDGLSLRGFQVETATDGLEALKVIRLSKPDVVVLDLMMPKLSGVEVLKFMRAQKELEALPVIVLSNAYMDPLVQEAAGLKAHTGLLKMKCNPASLAAAIHQVLEGRPLVGSVDHLLASKRPPAANPVKPLAASPPPSRPAPQETPPAQAPRPLKPGWPNEDSKEKARRELSSHVQALSGSLRQLFEAFRNAPTAKDREIRLQDFYRKVHFVTAMAGMAEYHAIGQMASAFEALLFAMMDKLPNLGPSLERTTSMAFDFLQELLMRPPDYRQGAPQNSSVLVVDDDRLSNRLVVSALRNAQLQARGTDNPETALGWIKEKQYDLILLDVEMPGMDGIELCRRLRGLPGYEKIPVIYVTLHSDFDTRARTALSGGNDHIAKPILPNELAVKVVMHLLKSQEAPTPG